MRAAEDQLVSALATEVRGPKRNGIYAVWLFTRVAAGLLPPTEVAPRTHRRRLEELERRLSSLSVPAPLRRALRAGYGYLAEGTPEAGVVALSQLAAPARDSLGPAAADALLLAVRSARTEIKESRSHERAPAYRA